MHRSRVCHVVSGNPPTSDDDYAFRIKRLSKSHSMHGNILFIILDYEIFFIPQSRKSLSTIRNLTQLLDTSSGVLANTCFSGKHHGIDTFINCVGNIGHFCPGGDRIFDHRFQ